MSVAKTDFETVFLKVERMEIQMAEQKDNAKVVRMVVLMAQHLAGSWGFLMDDYWVVQKGLNSENYLV